jgi:hypothetical protein
MVTHSDEILNMASRTCRDAISLAGRDHTPDEFKSLLTRLGSAVEVFLKDHIYLGAHQRWNFERLIDGLEPMGVPAQERGFLNKLRLAYNDAKHEPTYDAPVQAVIAILTNSVDALGLIAGLNLGDSGQPSNKGTRRLLWFAAWDHYIGGDTEFSIFLPCSLDIDIPPGFETIYLKMEEWDTIKAELSRVGSLCLGEACVPSKFFDFWNKEDDFLAAGSFEGNLRDMMAVLAQHERVVGILPELKRENEPYSMLAAVLFAITDLAPLGLLPDDVTLVCESILSTAEVHYAAPRASRLLQKYAAAIARLVCKCDVGVRAQLQGPLWVGHVRYAELEAERLFQSDHVDVMVLRNGCLVAKI